jgi:hypothetical protein
MSSLFEGSLFFWDRVSLCCADWPPTQDPPNLFPECWDYNVCHHAQLKSHFTLTLSSIKTKPVRYQWLTPVILATEEAKIKRITVWSQPRKNVSETPSQPITQTWWIPCDSNCSGGIGRRIMVREPELKHEMLPENNWKTKMGWRHNSNGKA